MNVEAYKKEGKKNFDAIEEENFKQGLNIKVEPENFAFENILLSSDVGETDISDEFFKKEFEKNYTKVNFFNQAHISKVTCIDLEKESEEKINVVVEDEGNFVHFIFILVPENVKKDIFITNTGNPSYCAQEIRVVCKKHSHVNLFTFQNFNDKTTYFDRKTVIQGKDSKLNLVDVSIGSSFSRYETNIFLNEENSSINQHTIYFVKDKQKIDVSSNAYHVSQKTFSDLVTRGVLKDEANGLSRSLVSIGKNANNSEGYETQDALILSQGVTCNAIPQLEIKNPDVKCSHGSTIGQVNKEDLFYLMSRGVSKTSAEKLIITGYFNSLIQKINNEDLKEKVMTLIEEKIE